MTTIDAEQPKGRDRALALIAMSLGLFLVAIDFSSLSVVIVAIEQDLDTTLNRAQWVINAYTVAFGVTIVTGGRLADMFGRKRIFMIGCSLFAVFSLVGGLAPDINTLIAARALTGIGGALVWPAVMGMTYAVLPKEQAGLAGGLILGVIAFGNATGALLGGFLTDAIDWRWVLYLNIPLALGAMWLAWGRIPAMAGHGRQRIDYRGIALLSAGIVLILVGLDIGSDAGIPRALTFALIGVGLLVLIIFLLAERGQGEAALIPRDVMRMPMFAATIVCVVLMSSVFFAALVYVPQFTQKGLGWSAFAAGLGLLPLLATQACVSLAAGPLYDRLGGRVVLTAGALFMIAGMVMMSFLSTTEGYVSVLPGMVVTGIGMGLFYPAVVTAATTAAGVTHASLAGGIVYMCQVAAGSLGLGINTAIVLAGSTLDGGITTAFVFDACLGAAALLILLVFVRGDPARPAVP